MPNDDIKKDSNKKGRDIRLWQRYVRQEGIISDQEEHNNDFAALLDGKIVDSHKKGDAIQIKPSNNRAKAMGKSTEVDRRTDQKLRQGKIAIEARCDLHGSQRIEAKNQCFSFLLRCYQQGVRCALIITGKGKSRIDTGAIIEPESGILKKELPLWLSEPDMAKIVLKIYPAKPKDGGSGAFYVYLRKKK